MPKINNIFVIDNDESALKVVESFLKDFPFNIELFTNPNEALDKLESVGPDLIFLDYFMPEMLGSEFMVKVSERLLHNNNWEVYLITSKEFNEEEKMSLLTLGITQIFSKPLKKESLISAINEYSNS